MINWWLAQHLKQMIISGSEDQAMIKVNFAND